MLVSRNENHIPVKSMIDFLQVIIDKQVNSDVAPSCLEMSRWYVYWWVKNSDEDDASTDTTNLFVEVSNTVMNAEAFGLENCKQKMQNDQAENIFCLLRITE